MSSPASLAAAQVFREEELPQIVVSGTAQRITTQGNEWVFRSAVPDRKLVADMVDFINEKLPKLKHFGFLFVNDDFGKGGFDAFTEASKKYGLSVSSEERYSRGDLDFTGQLDRIRASNPDAVWSSGRVTPRARSSTGRSSRWAGKCRASAPTALRRRISRSCKGRRQWRHLSHPFQPGDVLQPAGRPGLHRLVRKTYNKPPDYVHAQAFDATNIAIAAIERAKAATEPLSATRCARPIIESVRGPFKFDQKGDPHAVTHMVRIVDVKETDARS